MKKFLKFLDAHILKIGIGFLLAFIPLYPKLPLLNVRHTWVYVRMEDVIILALALIWLVQLFRGRVSLKTPLTISIFIFLVIGGASLVFSLIFLGPGLANFFPSVAVLHYFRRIEYIIPFFIAFSTIKSSQDVKHYLIIIALTLLGVSLYGFGQRYLGFPAFLTMNEEFAKGIPLYLPPTARVTSTFAGHYDLAAFLVLMIVFLGSAIFGLRKLVLKFALFFLVFAALILLLFTASRISFSVYLIAISFMLYLQNKKWLIIPVVIFSIILMSFASGASERFAKTFRVQKVVYTQTGQPIAVLEEPQETSPQAPPPPEENLPLGSAFLTVPVLEKAPEATTVATIRRSVIASLKTASASSEIATISGEFLIRRAIVYDISFTTRFQGEWPRAIEAFKRNILLGSGYSSISLATDNDYLRALGETGALGLAAFLTVFFVIILVLRRALKHQILPFERSVLIGLGAGFLSLLINATLIDIFEASKVSYTFWMILGITVGMANLKKAKEESLFKEAIEVIRLPVTAIAVFLILAIILFNGALNNYFTGDDFTWLKWAATSGKNEIVNFFFWADGFFYRPLAKTYFTLVYPFLELKPQGYHLIILLLHLSSAALIYLTCLTFTKRKLVALLAGLFFLLHPVNAESILWVASTSASFAVFFYLGSFLLYRWWQNDEYFWRPMAYSLSIVFFLLAVFSHELALTLPLVIFLSDLIFVKKPKSNFFRIAPLLPYFLALDLYLWLRVGAGAHGLTGDYSYNLKNFVFNVLGNLWGYLGINLIGENFIPVYDAVRTFLRTNKILSGVLAVVLLTVASAFLFRKKKQLVRAFSDSNFKILLFAGGWFIIALLPFLGLGNLAERHVYLASVGFVLILAILAGWVWDRLRKQNFAIALIATVILIGVVGSFYWWQMSRAIQSWKEAGELSNKILLTLPTNYASFSPKTTLYFVDLPIRQGRTWIFPVGLKDGLWFIYKDESLKIEKAKNVEEALDLADQNQPAHVFVFENRELKEAKRE